MSRANRKIAANLDPSDIDVTWIAQEFERHLNPDYAKQRMMEDEFGPPD
jgi:hypothetical protein